MLVSEIALVAALLAVSVRWFTAPADRRRSEILLLSLLLALPAIRLAESFAGVLLSLLAAHRPQRYDLYVYRFDALFGSPSFFLGRWVATRSWWTAAITQVYGMPVAVMLAVFIVYTYLREDEKFLVVRAFLFNLLLALPIYILFPVCGPRYVFAHFPQSPGPVAPHVIVVAAAPNGVPSVHNSVAMLCAAFLWPWKWGRVFGILFVALTMFATLANGEHYAFDLLSAIPFTWLVWAVTQRSARFFRSPFAGKIGRRQHIPVAPFPPTHLPS